MKQYINIYKKINKNHIFIAIRFFAEFTSRASTLITFPLMARYLGTEGYGVNAQTNTIISFLIPIATLGLGFGIVRLIAGKQSIQSISSRFYSTIVVVSLVSSVLSLIIFFLAPFINQFFIKVEWATDIIRWSSPLIFLSALELAIKDYFRARLRIISYSAFQILQTITYVIGVTLILTKGGGLLQVIILWLCIKIIFNTVTLIYFVLVGEISVNVSFMPKEELLSLIRFGFPIVIAGIGTWVTNVGDRWVIGYFMTIKDVAVYNAAYTLAGIIPALASPFWNPLYPLMSSYYNDKNFQALFQASRKYSNGFCLIGIPAVTGLVLLANPLLVKFGSSDFSIHPLIFGFIILGLFIDQFSASLYYQIYLNNDPHFIQNSVLVTSGVNILLNLVSVPTLGILGAAASTFFSYMLLDFILLKRVMSFGIHINEIYDFQNISKYFFSTVIMSIGVLFIMRFYDSNLMMLVVASVIGAGVYCIALLTFYKFNIQRLLTSI
jgi:O-antigen/teichoic acid export membrane protein